MDKIRPVTTLFLLMSADGKISTGDTDGLDFDRDLPAIPGVAEGLFQYYEMEKNTDLCSLNSGRVMAKMGANNKWSGHAKLPLSFVFIDNKPHLDLTGIDNYVKVSKKLIIVTTNDNHPAFWKRAAGNLEILQYSKQIDFADMFRRLKTEFGIERITIQSGGSLNGAFLKLGLIDHISLVVAPLFVGGKNTPTAADGEGIHSVRELHRISPLSLTECKVLQNSYIHLKYDVLRR